MKKILIGVLAIAVLGGAFVAYYFISQRISRATNIPQTFPQKNDTSSPETIKDTPKISVIAKNLDTPWALAFLPDGSLLITERVGSVRRVDTNGILISGPIATLPSVREIGEGGLLGMALHPDFSENKLIYFYYTYRADGNNTLNRVVRMTYTDNALKNEEVIIDAIPGASNHNGGRIKFGPDNFLYVTTGDAQDPSLAQNKNALAGKTLRVTDTGAAAPNNAFGNRTYSFGHRNSQGMAWDTTNTLWETEHGRSGAQSGLDEINIIESGKNYGWDIIQGDETKPGMETPIKNSGDTTWAPGGAAFFHNSLFFGGLRGNTLYEAVIENNDVTEVKEHFSGEFGRIRDVIVGPDNMLYISTSNRDGRGTPTEDDDQILRINPGKL